jgi:hypothetical protein
MNVKQVKNEDGTFSYLVGERVYIKSSKKDYSFFLTSVGAFSSSLRGIESQQRFWLKHGGEEVVNKGLEIIQIIK